MVLGAMAAPGMGISPRWDADLKGVTNLTQSAGFPAAINRLVIENPCGTVHVRGVENAPAGWKWNLRVRAGSDAVAQQVASRVQCRTEVEGDHLKLIVTAPEPVDPRAVLSELEITVPKATAIEARTRNGLIDITDLNADVEVVNQNGPVGVHRVTGRVRVQTAGGRLSVTDAGSAILRNQSGEIEAANINGALDAKTSDAPLVAENIDGIAALINQNGDIRASYIRGGMDAGASFGAINAHDIEGAIKLQDENGSVDVVRSNAESMRMN